VGGGVIRIVGTGGIVDSWLVTVLSSERGTRFSVLGSWFWKTEKMECRRDRVDTTLITTWNGGLKEECRRSPKPSDGCDRETTRST
jgi:hypothetical protein